MYGAGTTDKKLMAEVFSKLMDSNAKLNILKVALQKYKGRLGESVSSDKLAGMINFFNMRGRRFLSTLSYF